MGRGSNRTGGKTFEFSLHVIELNRSRRLLMEPEWSDSLQCHRYRKKLVFIATEAQLRRIRGGGYWRDGSW